MPLWARIRRRPSNTGFQNLRASGVPHFSHLPLVRLARGRTQLSEREQLHFRSVRHLLPSDEHALPLAAVEGPIVDPNHHARRFFQSPNSRVQVALDDAEVVLIRAVGLLDPADHGVLVAEVRFGQRRDVEVARADLPSNSKTWSSSFQ